MATILNSVSLALGHQQAGRLAEAEEICRDIVAENSGDCGAWALLGVIALQMGKNAVAVDSLGRAIALNPRVAHLHYNLGNAYSACGQMGDSIASYRKAIELQPDFAEAHNNLGLALQRQGQLHEAAAHFRRAVEHKPAFALAHNSLGTIHQQQGKLDDAVSSYLQAIQLEPTFAEACNNLGAAYNEQGQVDDAVAYLRRALQSNPELAEAKNNLGNAYREMGRIEHAIGCYREAVVANPDYVSAQSNLLYALYFCPGYDAATIYQEHLRWNEVVARRLSPFGKRNTTNRDPARRLKVGFVSRDFRDHCQSFFTTPLFERHDRKYFQFICFSDVGRPDSVTDRLRRSVEDWHDIWSLSDEEAAQMIRDCQVDLLVDLTMHMAHGRPLLFARKPVPLQACWLAYPGTSGLTAIDYRITDPYLDPPGLDDAHYTEESIRLPDCFWCYDPLASEPHVNPLPALTSSGITFGSLNSFSKTNPTVLRLWAEVLKAIDRSRLILLAPGGRSRQRVLDLLENEGIAPDRISFVSFRPRPEYLALYHDIDIGLDTFPANGHTTSLDSFWMGVPVITLAGPTAIGRGGVSILQNLGLMEFIANTPQQYVAIATELAADVRRLSNLRTQLRDRMMHSPLMDAPRFARNMEAAFRTMWQRWCERQPKQ